MPEFTKEKWKIDGRLVYALSEDHCNRFTAMVQAGHCYVHGSPTIEEMVANVHLIAAAPEMYGALKTFNRADASMEDFIIAKNKALAKAEGK